MNIKNLVASVLNGDKLSYKELDLLFEIEPIHSEEEFLKDFFWIRR